MKFLRKFYTVAACMLAVLLSSFVAPAVHANEQRVMIFSAVYDPASLVDGAGATTTVASPGSRLGDQCAPSFSLDLQGILLTCYISAAGTASVRFQNESTGTLDLASGTLRVFIYPRGAR